MLLALFRNLDDVKVCSVNLLEKPCSAHVGDSPAPYFIASARRLVTAAEP